MFCTYRIQNGREVKQDRSVPDTNFTITGRIVRGMELELYFVKN